MEELKREGDFYCSALRKLNFYGYYTATSHEIRGLGCMILELVDGDILGGEIDK